MIMIQVPLQKKKLAVILAMTGMELALLIRDDEDFYAYFEAQDGKRYYVAISPTPGRDAKGPPAKTNLKIDESVNATLDVGSLRELDRGYFTSFEIVPPNEISLALMIVPDGMTEDQLEREMERRIKKG